MSIIIPGAKDTNFLDKKLDLKTAIEIMKILGFISNEKDVKKAEELIKSISIDS